MNKTPLRVVSLFSVLWVASLGCSGDKTDATQSPDAASGDGGGASPVDDGGLRDGVSGGASGGVGGLGMAGAGGGPVAGMGGAGAMGGGSEPDAGAEAGVSGCAPLPSNAALVYVDKTSSRPSVGTSDCPFHTIGEASRLPAIDGARTIQIRGGVPAVTYQEAAAVEVKANVTLLGDGVDKVKISGGGACGTTTCAVLVRGGGVADQFTVTATTQVGVVLDGTSGLASAKHVTVAGATTAGVVVHGVAQIGPGFQALSNSGHGVMAADDTTSLTVVRPPNAQTANRIADNGGDGMRMIGGALEFQAGHVVNNGGDGIYVDVEKAQPHRVFSCVAQGNGRAGVFVGGQASAQIVNSLFTGNKVGVAFVKGMQNTLGLSCNSFVQNTATNLRSGLCIQNSGANSSQPAAGNVWNGNCSALMQREVNDCFGAGAYDNITFVPAVGGGPTPVNVVCAVCN